MVNIQTAPETYKMFPRDLHVIKREMQRSELFMFTDILASECIGKTSLGLFGA